MRNRCSLFPTNDLALEFIDGVPTQPGLFDEASDQRLAAFARLDQKLTRYASGLSRPRDFIAAARAGHPIGVEVGELSGAAVVTLASVIVDYGIPCFVDSGAFGVFRRGLRGGPVQPLDFDQVLACYDRILDAVEDYNSAEEATPPPLMVMPDIVDDQIGSLTLIRHHRAWIRAACQFTGVCLPIIPIQRGPHTLAEVYEEITQTLGSDGFCVGIPTNSAAISPDDFVTFLRTARPKAVHVLGALADSRLAPRLNQIIDSGLADSLRISADGNPLRSVIIRKGQGAEGRRQAISERLGRASRLQELRDYLVARGGHEGVRAELANAPPQVRDRTIALISDLSGASIQTVETRYLPLRPAPRAAATHAALTFTH